jgi:hypothetical protein
VPSCQPPQASTGAGSRAITLHGHSSCSDLVEESFSGDICGDGVVEFLQAALADGPVTAKPGQVYLPCHSDQLRSLQRPAAA